MEHEFIIFISGICFDHPGSDNKRITMANNFESYGLRSRVDGMFADDHGCIAPDLDHAVQIRGCFERILS